VTTSSTGALLARRLTAVQVDPTGVDLDLDAFAGVHLGGAPGWLTGEDPADLGVELTMPNLPQDLALPDPAPHPHRVRIEAIAEDLLRIRSGVPQHPVFSDDGTGLGIVTDPAAAGTAPEVRIEQREQQVVLSSGETMVRIDRYPFALTVERAGRTVLRTSQRLRQVAGLPTSPPLMRADGRHTIGLELGTEEDITGFGEQFGRLVKNGQKLDLRVEDALGTGTGLTYKPVPVWQSGAGYLGFLNTGTRVTCDVGHTMPSVLSLTAEDEAIDLYLVLGDDVPSRLARYTELTGRGPRPPLWAFGYWMGRCRYYSRAEMLEVADRMRTEQVPCDVLHLDPDWLVTDRLNTDFIWNTDRFGDRAEFLAELRAQSLRLSVWEVPYLDPASPRYAEAERKGYLVRTTAGQIAHLRGTPTPDGRHRAIVDLTAPEARAWWQRLHHPFLDDGTAVFKTDFGEGLPDDAELADGTPPAHAHNLFPLRYNAAISEGIGEHTGRSPLVWGRSGWAGSHRYPGQWGGDAESTVAGMQATVRGGLSYAVSAPGFWSHDIGGFFGPELTGPLYVRWTQFGALSPLMRAHGLRPREPWAFGPEALDAARDWVRRRYALLPHLWQVAAESAANGWPMMRPLDFHAPQDRVGRGVDDAFLLGRDLYVVPVFSDSADPVERIFWVPQGRWRDLYTGQEYEGGRYARRLCALDEMPVLAREGAVIPTVEITPEVRSTDDLLRAPWSYRVIGAVDGPRTMLDFEGREVTWTP